MSGIVDCIDLDRGLALKSNRLRFRDRISIDYHVKKIMSRLLYKIPLHTFYINLLKPTGHLMHQQFNIQQLYILPKCIYVFCIYLRTNSDLCHLQHKLIGFYNRDEKCLLRGTNRGFK